MRTLRAEREIIDVTRGGLFGGPADTMKKYVVGAIHFYIDDVEVDQEAFKTALDNFDRVKGSFDLEWYKDRLAGAGEMHDSGVENWFGMGDVERLVAEVERLRQLALE